MIDVTAIENLIFDSLASQLVSAFPTLEGNLYSEYTPVPEAFPSVCAYMAESRDYTQSFDDDNAAHQKEVTYEIDIFTNGASTKKTQANAIASAAEEFLNGLNMTTISRSQSPNYDRSIYRVQLRLGAIIGEPVVTEDGTTTYQIYRR